MVSTTRTAPPSGPRFVLVSDAEERASAGIWRFELRAIDGSAHVAAADAERDVRGERLQLLSVIRGLEALDQPSHVTLITRSGYVREGIRHGIAQWRANSWRWERFGEMVPVKNHDLWRRIDQALRYHAVECRPWKVGGSDGDIGPAIAGRIGPTTTGAGPTSQGETNGWGRAIWSRMVALLKRAA